MGQPDLLQVRHFLPLNFNAKKFFFDFGFVLDSELARA
jgi:hypothetical protein